MRRTGVTTNSPSISSGRSPSCSSGISSRSSNVSRLAVVAMRFPWYPVLAYVLGAFENLSQGKAEVRQNPGVTRAICSSSLVTGALALDTGQAQRRAQQHVGAGFQIFGGGVLLLTMAEPVDGASEDHGAGRDLLDVLRIVTGPRPAAARGDAQLLRGRLDGIHDLGSKGRRLARPEAVDTDCHPGLSRDVARQALQPGNEPVEGGGIGVAQIDTHRHFAGDGVDHVWLRGDTADRADGAIDRPRDVVDPGDHARRGDQGIPAQRHRRWSGVIGSAIGDDFTPGDADNPFDDADGDRRILQYGALLNV